MEEFVDFEFVLLDASRGPSREVRLVSRGPRRERVDMIARQFYEFLTEGDPADTAPHGMVMTHDFKLRRRVGATAGWVAFMVERGNGGGGEEPAELDEVAMVVFAAADDREGRDALRRLEPYINAAALPPAPVAVAVQLAAKVPPIVAEWYGKAVAGFFSADRTEG